MSHDFSNRNEKLTALFGSWTISQQMFVECFKVFSKERGLLQTVHYLIILLNIV